MNGALVKQLMEERGLTQEDLARAAGVTQGRISLLVNGKRMSVQFDTGLAIAEALGVNPKKLRSPKRAGRA